MTKQKIQFLSKLKCFYYVVESQIDSFNDKKNILKVFFLRLLFVVFNFFVITKENFRLISFPFLLINIDDAQVGKIPKKKTRKTKIASGLSSTCYIRMSLKK